MLGFAGLLRAGKQMRRPSEQDRLLGSRALLAVSAGPIAYVETGCGGATRMGLGVSPSCKGQEQWEAETQLIS